MTPSWDCLRSRLAAMIRNSFEVATPEATYYMYADTEKSKDEWIGAIGR